MVWRMNKKALTWQMTALLIIGLIVFILLFIFITETDVLAKIKAILPDFSSGNNDYPSNGNSGGSSNIASSTFLEFEKRSEGDVLEALEYGNEQLGRCSCGDNCSEYSRWVVEYSNKNNIPDALLLASLMMQESACKTGAASGSSYGLMQIYASTHCGNYGLPKNLDECKKELFSNPEKNIEVGSRILRDMYNRYKDGRTFSGACSEEYQKKVYTGWQAALRGYNGWGCDENHPEQDMFVEQVVERYNKLNLILKND